MKKNRFYWAMLFCSFLLINLIACGGGGGEGSITPAANDSASSTIGSTGGILATPSGNISLNIPANALNSSTPISIAQSTEGDPPGGLIGSYEFKPDGLTFNTPVTISVKYDPVSIPQGINETDLQLAYISSGGEWVVISESTVDTANQVVSGQTTHFTNFDIKPKALPFNSLIGTLNSVEVRSNGPLYTSTDTNTVNGVTTGYKWQCVEFVNRYYLQTYNKNIILSGPPGTNNGNNYYRTAAARGLVSYPNDGPEPPQAGDIIASEGGTWGHVAIVKEVLSGKVIVTQQNWHSNNGDLNFTLSRNGNHVGPFGGRSYPIKGWLRLPAAPLTPPSTPTGFTVTAASSSQIDLSWNASTGATGYKVYKSGSLLKTVLSPSTSTSDTGLSPSNNYCYYVIANNSAGDSVQTSQQCATTQAPAVTPPATPTGFVVTAASLSQIDLSWNASTGATGYKVYKSGSLLKTVLSPATSTSDTGLSPLTNYCYYVIAYNSAGDSVQTSQLCATTQAPPLSSPSAPTNFAVTAYSDTQIDLAWTAPTGTVTGYKIYKGGTYLKSVTTTSTSDTGLSASTNYCYYITAYNSAGESTQTSRICAMTQAPPSTSTGLIGTWNRIAVTGNYSTNLAVQITFTSITLESYQYIMGNCSWKISSGTVSNDTFTYDKDPFNLGSHYLWSIISGLEGAVTVTWIDNNTIILSWSSGTSKWSRQ